MTSIHPITASDQPVFPCWLWSSELTAIMKTPTGWGKYKEKPLYFPSWFTHYHPDQPLAPTESPSDLPAETILPYPSVFQIKRNGFDLKYPSEKQNALKNFLAALDETDTRERILTKLDHAITRSVGL